MLSASAKELSRTFSIAILCFFFLGNWYFFPAGNIRAEISVPNPELKNETTPIHQRFRGSLNVRRGGSRTIEFNRRGAYFYGKPGILRVASLPAQERRQSRIARHIFRGGRDSRLEQAGHQACRCIRPNGADRFAGRNRSCRYT